MHNLSSRAPHPDVHMLGILGTHGADAQESLSSLGSLDTVLLERSGQRMGYIDYLDFVKIIHYYTKLFTGVLSAYTLEFHF